MTPTLSRTYATPAHRRPAAPDTDAEEGSEDVTMDNMDPNMNGNYPDPNLESALPVKRQFRDPYADWWDPVEMRNYGETVHEDNDIMGVFSTEEYTHFSTAWGGVLVVSFMRCWTRSSNNVRVSEGEAYMLTVYACYRDVSLQLWAS